MSTLPHHHRRRRGISALVLAAALVLSACGGDPATSPVEAAAPTGQDDPAVARVGYFGGTNLWTLAEDSNAVSDALKKIGGSVQWNGPLAPVEASEAAKAGRIDFTSNSVATFFNEADSASSLVAFALIRNSGDNQGIVVRDQAGIGSVADLAGKRVAVSTKGSTGEYVLLAALESAGLKADAVKIVYIANPADGVSALASGDVDALATWDNFFASAQLVKDTSVLTTNAQTGARNWSLFVVTRSFLDEHPATVRAVFDGLVDQANRIRTDRDVEKKARLADGQPANLVDLVVGFDPGEVVAINDEVLAQIREVGEQTVRFGFRASVPDLSKNYVDVTTLGS
ncbi:NrtA/SsuA/CpmA family ABC transporter substrate-binding protein [Micromonospora cathayae]|uniref:NrtA/SsuA/CpmA family ABC transporter substrate-binding protein n=1 Tax=Micromonospora cathayae TaxID=3028804 RepID=A0ABY7ZR05_9ACTN|nr:NrtA/SsuA/CpmA family ABC transporter substrate-binding protein [Micromonospora sp. HUAS 3]WDZ84389.1 NrtA/SsuA/CpmA family ABC transporter substrate-binding protein [Micromonospora sp. HUAS 3]